MNKENKQIVSPNKPSKEKIIKNTFTQNTFWSKNRDNYDTILELDGKFFKKIELYTRNKENKIIRLSDLTDITVSFSTYDTYAYGHNVSENKPELVGKIDIRHIYLTTDSDEMVYVPKLGYSYIISNVYTQDNFFTILLGGGEDKKYVLCFEK